jgi:hypothetical protein
VGDASPILASYWSFKRIDMHELVTRFGGIEKCDVFADSGAFSAHTLGAVIDIDAYSDWLVANADVINFAAGLDVIFDGAATRRNMRRMHRRVGDTVKLVPTFHVGSPWADLRAMVKEYDFIALGGAVAFGNRMRSMAAWLTKAHFIIEEFGAVAHGFGLTKPPYPSIFRWYSVDSSYWRFAMTTGAFSLWDERTSKHVRIVSGKPLDVRQRAIVRSYGMDPETFATPGFAYITAKPGREEAARLERDWSLSASAEAWYRYAEHLRRHGRSVKAPEGVRGDGLKVYLSTVDHHGWQAIRDAQDRLDAREGATV